MVDKAVQMYRIAAAIGCGLNAFSLDQWEVLLEAASIDGMDGTSIRSLLDTAERLGVRSEVETVLADLAGLKPQRQAS